MHSRRNFDSKLASRWRTQLAVGGLLLALFALLLAGVQPNAFTADEPAYIVGGYTLLARGREALDILSQRGYPPLLPVLEAALFYAAEPDVPLETLTHWPPDFDPFINAFLPYLNPVPRVKLVTRIPTIWLTTVLGALVFRWGKDLWGVRAGLLALIVLTFDPTLLAHGRLATTDVGITTIGTAALYAAWRWSKTPSWRWALGTGALMGLAMLAKVSAPLWAIIVGLIMSVALIRERGRRVAKSMWRQAVTAAVLAFGVFWAGYAFTWGKVAAFPLPLPAPAHWRSTFYLTWYRSEFFALGQRQYGRWWWYFPLTFLLKNPIPLLIGFLAGCVTILRDWRANAQFLLLCTFPLLYAAVAVIGGMNIGYRHLLPVLPFIYIGAGAIRNEKPAHHASRITHYAAVRSLPVGRITFYALLSWYIVSALLIFPNEIAYFNELIGGPKNGYRYLADSNLEWGQSKETLIAYAAAHPDVQTQPPATEFRPATGRYIVGASRLQGLGIGDPDAYAWFRQREPAVIVDYNLLIYDVAPFDVDWLAQCGAPVMPLDEGAIERGFGADLLARRTGFDCTQAWLYPNGGSKSGIYALDRGLIRETRLCLPDLLPCQPAPNDVFIERHLMSARLSFDRDRRNELSPFVLYEMPTVEDLVPSSTVYAVPVDTVPAELPAFPPVRSPVALAGPLVYLGAKAYREAETLEVETWWQLREGPVVRAFSIMAHLISAQGEVIGTADGLGVWPLVLAGGDVIVQRHRFPLPPSADTEVWLRTGAYWLDTMARWPVLDGESPHDDVLFELITQDRP